MAGGSEHSFGIHVAQRAGMPSVIVERAREILVYLSQIGGKMNEKVEKLAKKQYQLKLFAPNEDLSSLKTFLERIDINALSPVEALLKLNDLKNMVKNFKN